MTGLTMRVHYDDDDNVDLLYFSPGMPDVGGSDMFTAPGVVVFVGTEDGHDVVGIEIIRWIRISAIGQEGIRRQG